MGKFFISGGGNEEDSKFLDEHFAKALVKKQIAYIPVAMKDNSKHTYKDCFNWIKNVFGNMPGEKIKIEMFTNISNVDLSYLKSFDAIYIGGGNTYKLLKEIRHSKFDSVLIDFVKKCGFIYGGSAGAVILGKNISLVKEENTIRYKDDKGLNLLRDLSILCHYKNSKKENLLIHDFMVDNKGGVLALPEKAGVIISGDVLEVIGSSPVYAYVSSKLPFKKVKGNLLVNKT